MKPLLREVTRSFVQAALCGGNITPAARVDFGLDTNLHTYALFHSLNNGHITPEALDEALGHGAKLSALVAGDLSNPMAGIQFMTSWDTLYGRDPANGFVAEPEEPDPELGLENDDPWD